MERLKHILFVSQLFLAFKADEMLLSLLIFDICAFQLIEEQLFNDAFTGFTLHEVIIEGKLYKPNDRNHTYEKSCSNRRSGQVQANKMRA